MERHIKQKVLLRFGGVGGTKQNKEQCKKTPRVSEVFFVIIKEWKKLKLKKELE